MIRINNQTNLKVFNKMNTFFTLISFIKNLRKVFEFFKTLFFRTKI